MLASGANRHATSALITYAVQNNWTLIDDSNRKQLFMDMVRSMDMSYSYKPVLLKAILAKADERGRVKLTDIVAWNTALLPRVHICGIYRVRTPDGNLLNYPFVNKLTKIFTIVGSNCVPEFLWSSSIALSLSIAFL